MIRFKTVAVVAILMLATQGCGDDGGTSGNKDSGPVLDGSPDSSIDLPTKDLAADAPTTDDLGTDGPLAIDDIYTCIQDWERVAYFGATYDIWGASASEVFAVGQFGLAMYDGTSWQNLHTSPLKALWGNSGSEVYALGDDELVRYDGSTVAVIDTSELVGSKQVKVLMDVWATDPNHVWVVSAYHSANPLFSDSTAYASRWDGSSWSTAKLFVAEGKTAAIWGSSNSDIWVVVDFFPTHFDGNGWTTSNAHGVVDLSGIWGSGPEPDQVLYAVGFGLSQHTPGGWVLLQLSPLRLNAIWGRNPTDIYAVGQQGTIVSYDGTLAVSVAPTMQELHGVWKSDDGTLYIASDDGVWLKRAGGCAEPGDLGAASDSINADSAQ